ncbi:MAG: alginate export family protein [Planctomycetota bacterium]|jgi:hypothetical protein
MQTIKLTCAAVASMLVCGAAWASDGVDAEVDAAPAPVGSFDLGGWRLEIPGLLAFTERYADTVQTDDIGTEYSPGAVADLQARLGVTLDSAGAIAPVMVRVEGEVDIFSGTFGGDDDVPETDHPEAEDNQVGVIRKGMARVAYGSILTLGGGFMTSDWGLGLVANAGANRWRPGSASFVNPRQGDRVLRGFVASGPWTPIGLVVLAGFDAVQSDDRLLDGDEAQQMVAAVRFGDHENKRGPRGGVYYARRMQEAEDGQETTANAFDLFGAWDGRAGGMDIRAAVEAVLVAGETELGPNPDFQTHDVLQMGAAAQVGVGWPMAGAVLDVLYASGDRNLDDGEQNGFSVDPNYEMGLLIYSHVLAAQTARDPIRAADPDLVGVPAEDLERLPTRGSATNTIAFFPKGWWRPVKGLEIYGGPLFAFSEVELTSARTTRLAGGQSRNSLDGAPGRYYCTELDLGVRYGADVFGTQLTVGVEGGVLLPGDALVDANGDEIGTVSGGRFMLDYSF